MCLNLNKEEYDMNNMVYDFVTHSLSYENRNNDQQVFSLLIDTLEIECELRTGKIVGVQGFLPLIMAEKDNINIKSFYEGDASIGDVNEHPYIENAAYDLLEKIPKSKKYFGTVSVKYDEKKGIIQLGTEIDFNEKIVKVNRNIYCGLDINEELKCIYIIPDVFKETFDEDVFHKTEKDDEIVAEEVSPKEMLMEQ